MSASELLAVLFIAPPLCIVAGWLGRIAQRRIWMLDRPYCERVAAIKSKR